MSLSKYTDDGLGGNLLPSGGLLHNLGDAPLRILIDGSQLLLLEDHKDVIHNITIIQHPGVGLGFGVEDRRGGDSIADKRLESQSGVIITGHYRAGLGDAP